LNFRIFGGCGGGGGEKNKNGYITIRRGKE
jgi:hypothetical protein